MIVSSSTGEITTLRKLIITAFAALLFSAASAAEPRILQTGDILEVRSERSLSVPKLRTVLREYGYHSFGPGDHFGHIIKITAVGPDKLIYRIKVHMITYEVTHTHRVRHVN
jgi:hypothetical protein